MLVDSIYFIYSWAKGVVFPTRIKIVPIERDHYIEMLEEEILNLKEQVKTKESKSPSAGGMIFYEGSYPIIYPRSLSEAQVTQQALGINLTYNSNHAILGGTIE